MLYEISLRLTVGRKDGETNFSARGRKLWMSE